MYDEHTIGVVIPAYNEAGFVGDVIREVPAYVDRIYAVDDRSTDGTRSEIAAAARRDAADVTGGDRRTGDGSLRELVGAETVVRTRDPTGLSLIHI